MIRTILFILFFVGIALFGSLSIWKAKQYSDSDTALRKQRDRELLEAYDHKEREEIKQKYEQLFKEHKPKHKISFVVCSILTLTFISLTVFVPESFHQVNTGEVAVVRHLGKITGLRQPGTYFDFYMTNKYERYDTKVQQDHILTAAYSKDGQTMELEVFLQYQIQSENVIEIASQYGSLDALQSRIETQTIEKTKAVMSSAEAMTIIQNRAQFSNDVSNAVREGISADYYVNVRDVVLTNIDFTDEFEKSVEDKVIAEQQKQAAITKAEAELEVAKLEAQKKIEEARGNAEAQKIIAQASAEAATYNLIELSRVLGYTVHETYLYSINGLDTELTERVPETDTTIYLGTKYSIEIPDAAEFKLLVEDYLKYLEYLKTWDGVLPTTIAGDDAISIIIPNN